MLNLLKEICSARGVSGDEGEVAALIERHITPLADSVEVDALGNVIAFKKGKSSDKKVMASAHMDEVGLYISYILDEGSLKFREIGMDRRVINGRRVLIGKNRVPGVIGTKPIHLQSLADREHAPAVDKLYIDIGAKDKVVAEKHVAIGDTVIFDSEFREFGDGLVKARNFDDRAGCVALIEAMKEVPHYDTYYVFTVLEESGCHGAKVAANRIQPDIGIIVETTTCADFIEDREWNKSTKVGEGAAIYLMDSQTYYKKDCVDTLVKIATDNGIKWQYKTVTVGGTEGGVIERGGMGAKVYAFATPCRNIHSGASTIKVSDLEETVKLLKNLLDTAL